MNSGKARWLGATSADIRKSRVSAIKDESVEAEQYVSEDCEETNKRKEM